MAERMYFPLDDRYYYIIQVYSNDMDGDKVTFKYFDKSEDEVVEYAESIEFTKNMVVGDGFNTLSLSREFILPTEFSLDRAYPNPFNPTTTLSFSLPVAVEVSITIYNLQGREVINLLNQNMNTGYHSVVWNANSYAGGIYFVRMIAGNYLETQKLILLK